ncbi:MAG: hypothetical protein MZV63_04030 [Marinilabiliales bacterium]|nr:hypothetical protein [Marinilabiliales bacterium]
MPDFGKYTKELKKLIEEADHILLICHINPDGDAAGVMLGAGCWIKPCKIPDMISPNARRSFRYG